MRRRNRRCSRSHGTHKPSRPSPNSQCATSCYNTKLGRRLTWRLADSLLSTCLRHQRKRAVAGQFSTAPALQWPSTGTMFRFARERALYHLFPSLVAVKEDLELFSLRNILPRVVPDRGTLATSRHWSKLSAAPVFHKQSSGFVPPCCAAGIIRHIPQCVAHDAARRRICVLNALTSPARASEKRLS